MLTDKQCNIISALAFSNMNIAEAARKVGYHSTNVRYHIGVIRKNTGLDPEDFFDLHDLYKMAGGENDENESAT